MSRHPDLLERMRSVNPVPQPDQTDPDELAVVFFMITEQKSAMEGAITGQLERQQRRLEPPRHPRRRPALAFAGGLIAALAAVGITALVMQASDSDPTTPPVTAPSPTAPPQTGAPVTAPPVTVPPATAPPVAGPPATAPPATAPPPVPVSDLVWSRVPHDDAVLGGVNTSATIRDVVYGHGVWVAGGWEYAWDGGPTNHAVVWRSADGIEWQRISDESFSVDAAGEGMHIRGIAASDRGFVAAGYAWEPNQVAAIWISDDGTNWTRVPDDAGIFGDDDRMGFIGDVVGVGNSILAVGSVGDAAAVWNSGDGGETWMRVPHDEAVFGREGIPKDPSGWSQSMGSIAVGPNGFVAVGGDGSIGEQNRSPDQSGAVWVSPDGLQWDRVPDDGVFRVDAPVPGIDGVAVALQGVAWTGDRFVATGRVQMFRSLEGGTAFVEVDGEGTYAALWHSLDGIEWTRVPHDPALLGDGSTDVVMTRIAAGPGGVIAVGQETIALDEDGNEEQLALAWTSSDGLTWARVAAGPAFVNAYLRGIIPTADGFIAVGGASTVADEWNPAAIWIVAAP